VRPPRRMCPLSSVHTARWSTYPCTNTPAESVPSTHSSGARQPRWHHT
jgi:hypothetical protein